MNSKIIKNFALFSLIIISTLLVSACSLNDIINKKDVKESITTMESTSFETTKEDTTSSSEDEATATKDSSLDETTTKDDTTVPTTQAPTTTIKPTTTTPPTTTTAKVTTTTKKTTVDNEPPIITEPVTPSNTKETIKVVSATSFSNTTQVVDAVRYALYLNKTSLTFNYSDATIVSSSENLSVFLSSVTKYIPELKGTTKVSAKSSGGKVEVTLTFSRSDMLAIFYSVDNNITSNLTTEQNTLYSKAKTIINSITTSNMSDFQKEVIIHDYLVKNVSYDTNISTDPLDPSHFAKGALLNKKAVCDGYAEAFSILCYIVGLDTKIVTGYAKRSEEGKTEPHAWNLIKLGNEWYHVDNTWDDPIVSLNSDDSTALKLFNNIVRRGHLNLNAQAIKSTHTWDASIYPLASTTATKFRYYDIYKSTIYTSQTLVNNAVNNATLNKQQSLIIVADKGYELDALYINTASTQLFTTDDRNYKILLFVFKYN